MTICSFSCFRFWFPEQELGSDLQIPDYSFHSHMLVDIEMLNVQGNIKTEQFILHTDFPMKACFSTDIGLKDHVYATVGNRLSIRFYRNRGFSMVAGFRLVFTAFREGNYSEEAVLFSFSLISLNRIPGLNQTFLQATKYFQFP